MRFLSLALLFALALSPMLAGKSRSPTMNWWIRCACKLASDADVGGVRIEVEVHNAVVTLKGKVRSDKQSPGPKNWPRKSKASRA